MIENVIDPRTLQICLGIGIIAASLALWALFVLIGPSGE